LTMTDPWVFMFAVEKSTTGLAALVDAIATLFAISPDLVHIDGVSTPYTRRLSLRGRALQQSGRVSVRYRIDVPAPAEITQRVELLLKFTQVFPLEKIDDIREALNGKFGIEGIAISGIDMESPRLRFIDASELDMTTTQEERATVRRTTPAPQAEKQEEEDDDEDFMLSILASAVLGAVLFGGCLGFQLLAKKIGVSREAVAREAAAGDQAAVAAVLPSLPEEPEEIPPVPTSWCPPEEAAPQVPTSSAAEMPQSCSKSGHLEAERPEPAAAVAGASSAPRDVVSM